MFLLLLSLYKKKLTPHPSYISEVMAMLYIPPGVKGQLPFVMDQVLLDMLDCLYSSVLSIFSESETGIRNGVFSHTEMVSVVIHHRVGWCK